MKNISIDSSNYPIIITNFSGIEPTMKEFEAYLDQILTFYQGDNRIVMLVDGTKSKFLSSDIRIKQGNWLKKHDALIRKHTIGNVFVIPSTVSSLILKGIFLIHKPAVPYTIVNSLPEAMLWAEEKIKAEKSMAKAS